VITVLQAVVAEITCYALEQPILESGFNRKEYPKTFLTFWRCDQGQTAVPVRFRSCFAFASVFPFGGFEWINSSSLRVAAGTSCHRNSIRVDHAGPKRTWLTSSGRGPKEQFLLQGGFLNLDASDEFFLSKEIAPRRYAMCSCKFYT